MNTLQKEKQPFYIILLLVLAGEAVFILPFVLARVFRPTFLEAFQMDNTAIGDCFAVYGFVALISYFFGGTLADRFSPRVLMATALATTALGGFYMATFPDLGGMKLLFGYWGFTTIFLFWSAMIKATRTWGTSSSQVRAFGLLEAGRGLVAATMGLICVFIFSAFITNEAAEIPFEERRVALSKVILFLSSFVMLIGLLIFLFLKDKKGSAKNDPVRSESSVEKIISAVQIPSVWLLMVIILCAYTGYKVTSIIPQYANEIVGFNEVESAQVGTFLIYMRPISAVLVVFIVVRMRVSSWMMIGFGVLGIGAIVFVSGFLEMGMFMQTLFSIFLISLGIYGVRALYFALMKEGAIPLGLTGTAVGLISVIGYTPDIFMGPVIGYYLDNNEGLPGYQWVFGILLMFTVIGFLASWKFQNLKRKTKAIDSNLIDQS